LGRVAEHLVQSTQAWTLFATHYVELTTLVSNYPQIQNVYLDVVEHGQQIVFMHQVKAGIAQQSYGLQVAALAGIPTVVLNQAQKKLAELEQQAHLQTISEDTSTIESVLLSTLTAKQPDDMTPKQALELVYLLHSLL